MKVSVHPNAGHPKTLYIAILAPWVGALLMSILLMWRVERLSRHVETTAQGAGELRHEADELRKSTERLDDSMQRLKERLREQAPAGAP